MRPSRRGPRLDLALLGGLDVIAGHATLGVLFEGYGPGTYLIHVGAFALLLAGLPTARARTGLYPDPRGVVTAGLAFGVLWAGLVPRPYFPTDPSALGVAVDRLGFVLLLAPTAAGYVLGAAAKATVATGRTRLRPPRRGRSRGTDAPDARRSGDLRGRAPDTTGLAILTALLVPMLGSVVVMPGPGGEYTGGRSSSTGRRCSPGGSRRSRSTSWPCGATAATPGPRLPVPVPTARTGGEHRRRAVDSITSSYAGRTAPGGELTNGDGDSTSTAGKTGNLDAPSRCEWVRSQQEKPPGEAVMPLGRESDP